MRDRRIRAEMDYTFNGRRRQDKLFSFILFVMLTFIVGMFVVGCQTPTYRAPASVDCKDPDFKSDVRCSVSYYSIDKDPEYDDTEEIEHY